MHKALFLDRDGTINIDKHYLIDSKDFEFEKNVVKALKTAYDSGYLLIVITNQSGVARGYFSETDVHRLHQHIQEQAQIFGFRFENFYFCPHYKSGNIKEYSIECNCRKPKTALLEEAITKYNVDIDKSLMIGDKDADILLGQSIGMRTVLVGTGYGHKYKNSGLKFDYFIEDFSGLPEIISAFETVQKIGGV